jgi:putative SOS response-associated peptidase YedK
MCTNFTLIQKNKIFPFADRLDIDADSLIYGDFKPGSQISIICNHQAKRQVLSATWWLYLQQTDGGLKPHKNYFSVNTNHKKLAQKVEYRKSRCIIPATAFVESQDGKQPHLIEPDDGRVIAFGGLYKEWLDKVTGEIVYSASIITLDGHKALEHIHRKSTPLWLPEEAYETWLDDSVTDTRMFDDLLLPSLRTPLIVTPINKTMTKKPISDSYTINV